MTQENSPPNLLRFLNAFQRIEGSLKKKYGHGDAKHLSLPVLLSEVAKQDRSVRRYKFDIETLQQLRNAVVHNIHGFLAEVTEKAVQLAEKIAEHLERPPRVDRFFREVVTIERSDSVAKAVIQMYENDFSQLPVTQGGGLEGLLTANTVARWLGALAEEDIFSLKETSVAEVLRYEEKDEVWKIISRETTLFDVLDHFHSCEQKGERLAALIITHSGSKGEKPLGIITAWDLVQIHKSLGGVGGT